MSSDHMFASLRVWSLVQRTEGGFSGLLEQQNQQARLAEDAPPKLGQERPARQAAVSIAAIENPARDKAASRSNPITQETGEWKGPKDKLKINHNAKRARGGFVDERLAPIFIGLGAKFGNQANASSFFDALASNSELVEVAKRTLGKKPDLVKRDPNGWGVVAKLFSPKPKQKKSGLRRTF